MVLVVWDVGPGDGLDQKSTGVREQGVCGTQPKTAGRAGAAEVF